jgi:hypothetical protein
MSKMADFDMTIQEMLLKGNAPAVVAKVLNVPMEWVEATVASMEPESSDEGFDVFDDLDVHALARRDGRGGREEDEAE